MKRFLLPTFVLALGCAAFSAFNQAKPSYAVPKPEHKVAICHGTASAKNPYNLIIVDESAKKAHLAGHGHNSAPDFILNGGALLSDEQIDYFRSLSDSSACGGGGGES